MDSRGLDPEQAEVFWMQPVLWCASEMFESFFPGRNTGSG